MITFDRNDLNLIATAIDMAIKSGGTAAAKNLLPVWDKAEAIAKEMDQPKESPDEHPES